MYMTCTTQLKYIIYNLPLRSYESIHERERGKAKKQSNGVRDAKVRAEGRTAAAAEVLAAGQHDTKPKRQNNRVRDAKVLVGHGGGG
jgi:hypothetical protein